MHSLMQPVFERGKYASWIAPPKTGINRQGVDFDYVRFHPDHKKELGIED